MELPAFLEASTPISIVGVLIVILALLFAARQTAPGRWFFSRIPLLVFAYFVPTLFSNLGFLPTESSVYGFIKDALLPASLVLLTLSVDVKAVLRLGRPALILFLVGTFSIVIGGPIAFLCLKWMIPAELMDEAWRGLAALSGSWIGGGANFVAIAESVGLDPKGGMFGAMIVIDIAVSSVWLAVLLFFAGREKAMDEKSGANRDTIDDARDRVAAFRADVEKPTSLTALLIIVAVGLGTTAVATFIAGYLPPIGDIISRFTWIVIIATTVGVALSFTRLRALEGQGASDVGSLFLYLLIASIGAQADFARAFEAPQLLLVGALWMLIHAGLILLAWRLLRVPIFFAAVGSQANVGGAASAPIVASAFHPALAPIGVLLAVAGYVLGTYAALLCAYLLKLVA